MRAVVQDLMLRLLSGTGTTAATLRAQYERARIAKITFSGVGFFVDFEVPSDAVRIERARLAGGDVAMEIENLERGAGCVLFVENGAISFLEGYTYGECWPERPLARAYGGVIPLVP